jgi:hypothetical protein
MKKPNENTSNSENDTSCKSAKTVSPSPSQHGFRHWLQTDCSGYGNASPLPHPWNFADHGQNTHPHTLETKMSPWHRITRQG